MTSIITRTGKGSALDHSELDANWDSLSGINEPQTGATYTVAAADQNRTIEFNRATDITVTLTLISTLAAAIDTSDFKVTLLNIGDGDVVITPTTDTFFDGSTSKTIGKNSSITIQTDSTAGLWNIIDSNGMGRQSLWIPISSMHDGNPAATEGSVNGGVGSPQYSVRLLLDGEDRYAEFAISFPKRWDLGSVTAVVHYLNVSAGNGDIVIDIDAVAGSDTDLISILFGTSVSLTDTVNTNVNRLNITSETSAITIGGTPAVNDICYFRVGRRGADASDTETGIVYLSGVEIFYNSTMPEDS